MDLRQRLALVKKQIEEACELAGRNPEEVVLLPISKRQDAALVREAVGVGLATLGESRVQELAGKSKALVELGIVWHMVGSVQTNKVRQLLGVEGLAMVQSLDRHKLADSLQEVLGGSGRTVDVLLQVNATGDERKHGLLPEEVGGVFDHVVGSCPDLRPRGLMAMGPLHGDPALVFSLVARLREELQDRSGMRLAILSMGMTGDMAAAIAAGSTMVRVGTGVFGPRV